VADSVAYVDPDDPSDELGEMGHDGTTNEPSAANTERIRVSAEVSLVLDIDWSAGSAPDAVAQQAMQDALGHTGAVVEHVFDWEPQR